MASPVSASPHYRTQLRVQFSEQYHRRAEIEALFVQSKPPALWRHRNKRVAQQGQHRAFAFRVRVGGHLTTPFQKHPFVGRQIKQAASQIMQFAFVVLQCGGLLAKCGA